VEVRGDRRVDECNEERGDREKERGRRGRSGQQIAAAQERRCAVQKERDDRGEQVEPREAAVFLGRGEQLGETGEEPELQGHRDTPRKRDLAPTKVPQEDRQRTASATAHVRTIAR